MTDSKNIKAFECCEANGGQSPQCDVCPYHYIDEKNDPCYIEVRREILKILNNERAQIKSLEAKVVIQEGLIDHQQAENEALIAGQETISKYIKEQQAEIETQSQNFKILVFDHRCLQQSFDNLKGLYQAEKEKVESAKSKSIYFAKELQKARAEIERLEERIIEVQRCDKELIETLHKVHEEKIETAKAEAIKEFVARLIIVNETTAKYCEANEKVVRVTDIEDLVKEMEGEAE